MSQSPYRNPLQKPSVMDRVVDIGIVVVLLLVVIVTLYPFLNVLAISFNASSDTVKGGITIFPRAFTFDNYRTIFSFGSIPQAFLISVLRTVVGTVLSLIACSMVAYVLSRKDFVFRNFLSRYLAITMYVSGGMIPFFILIRDLHLMNTFTVYILPGLVNVFFIFMIRSFIDALPYELQESAKLDGANDFTIFWRVILPLCKPVLATAALFIAVGQWNSWFDTYLFNGSNPDLTTLQFELMKILQSTQTGQDAVNGNDMARNMQQVSPESIKMAITMVTTVPILMVYPFLQRYFVAGMTLGAVKG
ncbi:carbohydrate ABC transporter permease [Deinococcus misasensis]|uniref:carbohydrate ABC transporter permease n=1 Tax=Deinococcus misasensis TaxID=392413 RepID=UPI00054E91B5|nr:carbohydrate ABC transporter permease [Deinococcus misasensis]